MQLANVLPVIVPRAYFSLGNFPSYCLNLRHPELCVTWVDISTPALITYVTKDAFAKWQLAPTDLHELALENLRKSDQVFTHEKVEAGQCLWKAMMQGDALGSSRLLLSKEINEEFPDGSLAGLPDRSCAFVINSRLDETQAKAAAALVEQCFTGATTPMLSELYPLRLFTIDA